MDLSILEHDLAETRELLATSAFSGHTLLAEQARELNVLPLAHLLFISASLGEYDSATLTPVAVGLELLRLAAETHYRADETPAHSRNLLLVTADYFYAKAIQIASSLDKGYVIEQMVGAIADIAAFEAARATAGGETAGTAEDAAGGCMSLFTTAVRLGAQLGASPSDALDPLTSFASSFGGIYRASIGLLRETSLNVERHIAELRDAALRAITPLPVAQSRLLGDLIAARPLA